MFEGDQNITTCELVGICEPGILDETSAEHAQPNDSASSAGDVGANASAALAGRLSPLQGGSDTTGSASSASTPLMTGGVAALQRKLNSCCKS